MDLPSRERGCGERGDYRSAESPARSIPNVFAAPPLGHFTGECKVGETRKADVVVRLWDERVMPIECEVSNSELNSIKRLTNDAAAKAAA